MKNLISEMKQTLYRIDKLNTTEQQISELNYNNRIIQTNTERKSPNQMNTIVGQLQADWAGKDLPVSWNPAETM